jgi:hypothetical protein
MEVNGKDLLTAWTQSKLFPHFPPQAPKSHHVSVLFRGNAFCIHKQRICFPVMSVSILR